jgi:hypothetical protein
MLRFGFVGLMILLVSCSSTSRKPSSVDSSLIQEDMKKYLSAVSSPSYDKSTCGPLLTDLQKDLHNIDWNAYTNEDLKIHAAESIQLFWQLRLAIHRKLSDVEKNCNLLARDIFHQLRDGEDYLGEFAYNVASIDPMTLDFQKQPVPIYDRAAYPAYFVRPDLDDPKFKFQSGDLMLARGVSFISAIISQISDNKSHFSHVVFTNVDAKTQVPSTVEAYVGSGSKEYDIDFALKNENARLLVLRPKSRELGEKATEFAMKAAKSRVPYDYQMNFKDYSVMSCVEVAVYSYDKGSNGVEKIPAYPAQLNLKNDKFLTSMALKRGSLITPDDLETDPRFDLVLDWKDYRLVRDSRHKDAILSEMMRWLGELNYNFHDGPKSLIAKYLVQPSRRSPLWPLVQKITKAPNIDKEIPKQTLGVMTVLSDVSNTLLAELRKIDAAYVLRHKRPMTNQQLREALDKFRREDLANYKNLLKKSQIHRALHP